MDASRCPECQTELGNPYVGNGRACCTKAKQEALEAKVEIDTPPERVREFAATVARRLEIKGAGEMAYWLRDEIGRGPLAGFFVRDGRLVYTPRESADGYVPPSGEGDDDGPAQVRQVAKQRLAALLQFSYDCYAVNLTGAEQPEMFPRQAAEAVALAPEMCPNLRPLAGVVHTPVVRADGSVLGAAGYDRATRLLHLPTPGLVVPPVPDAPTDEDVAASVALLDEMTGGFKWEGKHDRANFYGLLLTPMMRELTPPPYKMFGVNAHQPGSGKTLLATVARTIHGGVVRSEMPGSDEELKKVIVSVLMTTTAPIVHVDNVSGVLRSSVLAGLLTSREYTERVLGGQDMPQLANDRVWVLTGNNLALGGDLVRRTINVAIDPGVPNPETRTGFAITDLEGWAAANRGRLIAALLTLIRAWVVADKPLQARQQSDGYAAWESAVGGILELAGVSGSFDAPASRAQQAGAEDEEWATFLIAIERELRGQHFTVRQLVALIDTSGSAHPVQGKPIRTDELPSGVDTETRRFARSLGAWIKNRQGRYAGALTVRPSPRPKTSEGVLWVVERHGGDPFLPPAGPPAGNSVTQ